MKRAPGRSRTSFALPGVALLALAACATPTTDVQPTTEDAVYTASGRYPAERAGVLIAQNAALRDGRGLCEQQGKRFRPLASVVGEDPASGEAVYAVRFRCIAGRASRPTLAPIPSPDPATGRRM